MELGPRSLKGYEPPKNIDTKGLSGKKFTYDLAPCTTINLVVVLLQKKKAEANVSKKNKETLTT
jgi:hypothetical protein